MKLKDILWFLITGLFGLFIIVLLSREEFNTFITDHPYLMGFVKTSILATLGELLVLRMATGKYLGHKGTILKFIVWGFLGMAFVLVFPIFSEGVIHAQGKYLPHIQSDIVRALVTSTLMNVIFAPTFMLLHRVTDTYIDLGNGKFTQILKVKIDDVISLIDFRRFIKFTLLKTIPLFWIPAHTITFSLPEEYRVLMAAFLSIALGIILSVSKRKVRD